MNITIVIAIIIQWLISARDRVAGAVVGFLITTGILIWGLTVYSEGNYIEFSSIRLSQTVFLIFCLVWYALDVSTLVSAKKVTTAINQTLVDPLLTQSHVSNFYRTTKDAWASGKLARLNKQYQNEGNLDPESFIKKYLPVPDSSLRYFFERLSPIEGEYLVGVAPAWFVLTNFRLVQKDGRDKSYQVVNLTDVVSYKVKGLGTKTMTFNLRFNPEITIEKVAMYPTDKALKEVLPITATKL